MITGKLGRNKISSYMNRMVKALIKAQETGKRKGWNRIYLAIDLHETCLRPTWTKELAKEFYPYAKEVLQKLSAMPEMCLILWSCSLPELNKEYSEYFKENGINFDYINENPECPSTDYANFDLKLYFSLGFDDKFGFDPEEDWLELLNYLNNG